MFGPATSPKEAPPCACCAGADTRTERQLAMLQELAEIGMDLARAVRREARAEPQGDLKDRAPARSAADFDLALSRIARAVRQTLALEAKLAADHRAGRQQGLDAARKVETQAVRAGRRALVRQVTAEAIEVGIKPEGRTRWLADMDLRLERYDHETREDLDRKPVGALVAEICRALGVKVDWSLWEDQDWARDEAETKAPGSPYAYHRFRPQPPPDPEPPGCEPVPDPVGARHPP